MDALLAALECYNTFLGAGTLGAAQLLGGWSLPGSATRGSARNHARAKMGGVLVGQDHRVSFLQLCLRLRAHSKGGGTPCPESVLLSCPVHRFSVTLT